MARQEMKHLNLFPAGLPKDEAMIVVNALRGNLGDHSKRDIAEAAWWVAGYAVSFMPDNHAMGSGPAMSAEDAAAKLEEVAKGGEWDRPEGMKAIPWALLLPAIIQLFLKFAS